MKKEVPIRQIIIEVEEYIDELKTIKKGIEAEVEALEERIRNELHWEALSSLEKNNRLSGTMPNIDEELDDWWRKVTSRLTKHSCIADEDCKVEPANSFYSYFEALYNLKSKLEALQNSKDKNFPRTPSSNKGSKYTFNELIIDRDEWSFTNTKNNEKAYFNESNVQFFLEALLDSSGAVVSIKEMAEKITKRQEKKVLLKQITSSNNSLNSIEKKHTYRIKYNLIKMLQRIKIEKETYQNLITVKKGFSLTSELKKVSE